MNPLIEELGKLAIRPHFWVDGDNWYSCPKAPDGCADEHAGTDCNCGADAHNAKVETLLAQLREAALYKGTAR
jgi:hypothetical protein